MLNYSLHKTEAEEKLFDSEFTVSSEFNNPFPGLRPFGIDECHLFFGRENQVDEILLKLYQNKFVSLLGYSGSGKSSLMHCGVIPVLYGGFMTGVGPNWNVIISRPGGGPIDNLAAALVGNVKGVSDKDDDTSIRRNVTAALLKTGSKGLVDIAKQYKVVTGENLLILIDQFEELFRYADDSYENKNEAAQFVNLLISAVEQNEVPIYVAITMRSDFIGESAQYSKLIDHINNSSYVIPLMSRQQKRIAIEGPVAVGGGRISDRLVNKLLQEVGDNQDQLPIMQHALMRTWEYWVNNREQGEEIDIRHYNAVGKISDALSLHADEAYDELTDKGKRIAEVLFKALTEVGEDNFGIRRRSSVNDIASIGGVSHLEVIEIVEHFRKPGRSLLMPALPFKITSDTMLEISHESLMRIWTRLRIWVEEESESAKMYLRISEAAEMHQIGRSGLWRPPDLQLALNWQKKQDPTRQWAERYNKAFERANVFLDTSKVSYEAEQKSLELKQKRDLKKAKVMALILGFAAIIAIFMFVWAITQQIDAEKQKRNAEAETIKAKAAQQEALILKDQADKSKLEAEASLADNIKLSEQLVTRLSERDRAIAVSERNILLAEQATKDAQIERNKAFDAKLRSDTLRIIATDKTAEAKSLLMLVAAQSMTTKSLQEPDDDLKGLLAQQAYQFNKNYGGYEFDKYIYDGLYYAISNFKGVDYNTYKGHIGAVKALSFVNSSQFYSVSSDGNIMQWDLNNNQTDIIKVGSAHNYPLRDIAISNDKKWMAVASDSSAIEIYNMGNLTQSPTLVSGHRGLIYKIKFLPDNKLVSLGYDGVINIYDLVTHKNSFTKKLGVNLRAFDVSKDGSWLVASTIDGQIIYLNLITNQQKIIYELPSKLPIHDVKISNDGAYLAFAGEDTYVYLWSIHKNEMFRKLRGHTSRINSIEFSHDGNLLATASFDNSVRLWNLLDIDQFPIVMKDNFNSYAWDVSFSNDDKYVVLGTSSGVIKKWPTHSEQMADEMCKQIKRNMTMEEWERFVGNNIEFRNTCISLLVEKAP